ncbi:MAG: hypothetical protein N2B57_02835 [Planctomycetales bacterium]
MSIIVVCQNCLQRFQVSDKFAGKKGPCPKCKTVLRVPLKEEEVKVHSAEETRQGPRGKSGELVLKPISRETTQLGKLAWGVIGGIVVALLVLVLVLRGMASIEVRQLIAYVGVVLLAPPLVVAGYWFLKNDDLEPYRGWSLWIRAGICSVIYILSWAAYGYLIPPEWKDEFWKWAFLGPALGVVGATASFACFDLDFGSGFFHFTFYAGVTALLGLLMGLPLLGA